MSQIDPTSSATAPDPIDRRGFLKCMAWAGTGVLWTVSGGVLSSRAFGQPPAPTDATNAAAPDFTFAQLSDSHIGFAKPPNTDVISTYRAALARIRSLPRRPDFLLHTGDLTHLSKPDEFDAVDQLLRADTGLDAHYIPGEHDVFTDDGKRYLERFGKGTQGTGYYSFDHHGVHFVAIVNVANLKPGGLGNLGAEQLAWLKDDLAARTASTPIVVFAHVPLWAVYPKWGWGTDDSEQALTLLRRFGAVTVLNGHIHQVMQKTEGHITFHTARSTAFPQPAPGTADSPGPIKNLPAEKLRSTLGLTTVNYTETNHTLAIVDPTLE